DYFVEEYTLGRTPNPCVVCNTWLKFGKLWSYGKQLDADFIATGHYVQVLQGEVHRGIDPAKDQSYVLFGLRKNILPHLLFPIGGLRKDEVRALARAAGLNVAEKLTIGQRKGFGFGSATRRYVLEIIPETRVVVIGDRADLLASALLATRVN